jgi:hypothetical protein
MDHMAAAEVAPKSPWIPLLKRRNFLSSYFNPSFEKRGRGDFWLETVLKFISTSFRHATLVLAYTLFDAKSTPQASKFGL